MIAIVRKSSLRSFRKLTILIFMRIIKIFAFELAIDRNRSETIMVFSETETFHIILLTKQESVRSLDSNDFPFVRSSICMVTVVFLMFELGLKNSV